MNGLTLALCLAAVAVALYGSFAMLRRWDKAASEQFYLDDWQKAIYENRARDRAKRIAARRDQEAAEEGLFSATPEEVAAETREWRFHDEKEVKVLLSFPAMADMIDLPTPRAPTEEAYMAAVRQEALMQKGTDGLHGFIAARQAAPMGDNPDDTVRRAQAVLDRWHMKRA